MCTRRVSLTRGSRILAVIHGPHVPYHANAASGNQRDIFFRVVPEPSWPGIVDKVVEGVNRTFFWDQAPYQPCRLLLAL
jgi:hypothetical protein